MNYCFASLFISFTYYFTLSYSCKYWHLYLCFQSVERSRKVILSIYESKVVKPSIKLVAHSKNTGVSRVFMKANLMKANLMKANLMIHENIEFFMKANLMIHGNIEFFILKKSVSLPAWQKIPELIYYKFAPWSMDIESCRQKHNSTTVLRQ